MREKIAGLSKPSFLLAVLVLYRPALPFTGVANNTPMFRRVKGCNWNFSLPPTNGSDALNNTISLAPGSLHVAAEISETCDRASPPAKNEFCPPEVWRFVDFESPSIPSRSNFPHDCACPKVSEASPITRMRRTPRQAGER